MVKRKTGSKKSSLASKISSAANAVGSKVAKLLKKGSSVNGSAAASSKSKQSKTDKSKTNQKNGGKKRKATSELAPAPPSGSQVNVHRCAFSEWTPEGIETFAAHPQAQMLALARAGSGNIEVWAVEVHDAAILGRWRLSVLVPGTGTGIVRSLAWAGGSPSEPDAYRLFGASVEGVVFEVDLVNSELTRCAESPGGSVWCLCAAPYPERRRIAAGCEDGTIRIFRVPESKPISGAAKRAANGAVDADEIEYDGSLGLASRRDDDRERRVLALAWHPKDPSTLFSTGADGIVRKWDTRTRRDAMQIKVDGFGSAAGGRLCGHLLRFQTEL